MKITRRFFASLLLIAAPLIVFSLGHFAEAKAPSQYLAFIGTYTTKTDSKGIYAFRFDAATGTLSPVGVAAQTHVDDDIGDRSVDSLVLGGVDSGQPRERRGEIRG